jgi:hypothetical protein
VGLTGFESLSLKFLSRFACQDRADWLTPKRLAAFLAGIRYCGSTTPETMHARVNATPRGATGDAGIAATHVPRALLAALRALVEQIDVLIDQITEQLHSHADAHVFTSLPRAGTVRAARLLAEIGDARGRFPTPEALASLAGAAPATRQSGKSRTVGFRWAVDRQLRGALVEWAGDSRLSNAWAADCYRRARQRGHDHPRESWPGPGSMSCGAACKTAWPTTPPTMPDYNASPKPATRQPSWTMQRSL